MLKSPLFLLTDYKEVLNSQNPSDILVTNTDPVTKHEAENRLPFILIFFLQHFISRYQLVTFISLGEW